MCHAFGITMSEFFSEKDSNVVELTPQTKELLDAWMPLSQEQREAILHVARAFHQN